MSAACRPLLAILLALSLCAVRHAQAEGEPWTAPPDRLTPELGAKSALDAFQAGGRIALAALAETRGFPTWLVADLLCDRGEHDAAALASASPSGPRTEGLPAYVDAW